jgi:hypothetical protein
MVSHRIAPADRVLIAAVANEKLHLDFGEFDASDELCVFVNYRLDDSRWCRVARSYGRHVVVFQYRENEPIHRVPRYGMAFLSDDGSLMAYDHYQFTGAADQRVCEWLAAAGARKFTGKGWQRRMGEAMANLASQWTPPWSTPGHP